MPPDARLADAPHLQELREPSPPLRVVPRHILQRAAPVALAARLRASAGLGGGAVLVHVALGAAFVALLSFRDADVPREVEIPVEVVAEPPKAPAKPAAAGTGAKAEAGPAGGQRGAAGQPGPAGPGPAKGDPAKGDPAKADPASGGATKPAPPRLAATSPEPAVIVPAAPAPQASPATPAPPQPRPLPQTQAQAAKPAPPTAEAGRQAMGPASAAPQPAPQPAPGAAAMPKPATPPPAAGVPEAPKLVAPPLEPGKAAAQLKEDRPANLVPDEHQTDQATREARPAAVPRALTTPDARARTSVPAARAQPAPDDRPTPPTTAKVPSQADKLAAVLPMGPGDAASPFRAVLAGNAAAQLNAAYGGVVQGRIRQATAELSALASAQQLSGAVAVTFTVDDAGGLSDLRVVQSSGDDQLDAMVLGAIRRIAPFPAPPPDAEHTFNKAFLIGR